MKRLLLTVVVLLALVPRAQAAVAFDTFKFCGDNAGGTSSFTCPGGFTVTAGVTNPIVFVGVEGPFTDIISGCTVGGNAMTKVGAAHNISASRFATLFVIVGVTVNSSLAVVCSTTGASDYIQEYIVSYGGVNQSTTLDSNNFNTTTGTSLTTPTTVVAANSWLVEFGILDNGSNGPPAAGAGTVRRVVDTDFDSGGFFDSNGTVSTGTQNLIFTESASGGMVGIIASITVPGAGGATVHAMTMLGVGK